MFTVMNLLPVHQATVASCGLAYGHVEALWKANMGESGALKSGPLVVKVRARWCDVMM